MTKTATSCYRSSRGFSLIEIIIVVVLLGILGTLIYPLYKGMQEDSQNKAFIKSVQTSIKQFKYFSEQTGSLPPESSLGKLPAGMEKYLSPADWKKQSPIGGSWRWSNDGTKEGTGVSVYMPSRSEQQMSVIDATFDDGSLSSGRFRAKLANREYIYLLKNGD